MYGTCQLTADASYRLQAVAAAAATHCSSWISCSLLQPHSVWAQHRPEFSLALFRCRCSVMMLLLCSPQWCHRRRRQSPGFSIREERGLLRDGHWTPRDHIHGQTGAPQEPVPQLQEPEHLPRGAAERWRPAVPGETVHEEQLAHYTGTHPAGRDAFTMSDISSKHFTQSTNE